MHFVFTLHGLFSTRHQLHGLRGERLYSPSRELAIVNSLLIYDISIFQMVTIPYYIQVRLLTSFERDSLDFRAVLTYRELSLSPTTLLQVMLRTDFRFELCHFEVQTIVASTLNRIIFTYADIICGIGVFVDPLI